MIDLSNVIALTLGSDDVLEIQDAIGTVLWQKTIYYNVNISAGSNGTVSVNGVSGNYSQSVPSGTVLTIEGTGNTGYDFDEWSDGNSTNPRTITVTGDLTLTASFESATPLPNYFYVEDASGTANTLSIQKNASGAPTIEIYKSTDQQNWELIGVTSTTAITVTIPANGKLYLKATADAWGNSNSNNKIFCDGDFNVGGNIMSLLYSDNFIGQTSFPTSSTYNFNGLFQNVTTIVNAENLILPATTLTDSCYRSMFDKATNLLTAPALPATTLDINCYHSMFYGTAITQAPALPATTVYDSCYKYMFNACTALTTAPELPATTLVSECYGYMFYGCSSLTTAPVLPVTTLNYYSCRRMFYNCTALITAPVLPATTLVTGCYKEMFRGCTNLNSVTTYATNISASDCLTNWLDSVAATGDFYNLGSATYTSGDPSGIPTGWTEHTSL